MKMVKPEKSKNDPKMASSGCSPPALTVARLNGFFKRFLEKINEEIGDDEEKMAKWESNIRSYFNV